MIDLSNVPTDELARALAARPDLVKSDGLVSPAVWQARCRTGAIPCVDSVAIRMGTRDGGELPEVELLTIVRNTGRFAGKLCTIGGVVALNETVEDALRRHWHTDLGVEIKLLTPWNRPRLHQGIVDTDSPERTPGFQHREFDKHAIAGFYLVEIQSPSTFTFGATDYGREARSIHWLREREFPPPAEFAYDLHEVIFGAFDDWRQLGR